ncbi:hypothetical protein Tsp_09310 [Trichinella spiralis]|nr:hypothetical protein Tsp_09242 [Trichinella spiralis]XP_003375731.1 hypothetical protein Tsp_09310 [Trichinella spiralis]
MNINDEKMMHFASTVVDAVILVPSSVIEESNSSSFSAYLSVYP